MLLVFVCVWVTGNICVLKQGQLMTWNTTFELVLPQFVCMS